MYTILSKTFNNILLTMITSFSIPINYPRRSPPFILLNSYNKLKRNDGQKHYYKKYCDHKENYQNLNDQYEYPYSRKHNNYKDKYLEKGYDIWFHSRKKSNMKDGKPYNNKSCDSKNGTFELKNYEDVKYRNNQKRKKSQEINMKMFEKAGFDHLYGVSPVLYALSEGRRELTDFNLKFNSSDETLSKERRPLSNFVKPQSQLKPYLFLQDNLENDGKYTRCKSKKTETLKEVLSIARKRNVPICYVDKGVLNSFCENRPHQGFILRCGRLRWKPLPQIFLPSPHTHPPLWLVLDEIVDPQNLGALLRSASVLSSNIQVMVCSKNSAPPSAVVSASSAGALEFMSVYSTSNLPRTLQKAKEDGWRVIGTITEQSIVDEDMKSFHELKSIQTNTPTVVVLGSEGYGLRKLVLNACTDFLYIKNGRMNDSVNKSLSKRGKFVVDSFNVSVSGGIILWHLLNK